MLFQGVENWAISRKVLSGISTYRGGRMDKKLYIVVQGWRIHQYGWNDPGWESAILRRFYKSTLVNPGRVSYHFKKKEIVRRDSLDLLRGR